MADDELLTAAEAADLIGVVPMTIYQWVNRGHLRPIDERKPMLFTLTAVTECAVARRTARQQQEFKDKRDTFARLVAEHGL